MQMSQTTAPPELEDWIENNDIVNVNRLTSRFVWVKTDGMIRPHDLPGDWYVDSFSYCNSFILIALQR